MEKGGSGGVGGSGGGGGVDFGTLRINSALVNTADPDSTSDETTERVEIVNNDPDLVNLEDWKISNGKGGFKDLPSENLAGHGTGKKFPIGSECCQIWMHQHEKRLNCSVYRRC